jgi:hypothetical protein
MVENTWNPWKMTTIGIGLAAVVALVTGVVVANWTSLEPAPKAEAPIAPPRSAPRVVATPPVTPTPTIVASAPAAAPLPVAAPQHSPVPSRVAIDACNQQAAAQTSQTSKTMEVVKDGAIGAAVGAVVGAAGGAIAGGGSGAGKGAAIGGVLGAGGGALYGVNENRKNDERYRDVYASCMRSRGYTG